MKRWLPLGALALMTTLSTGFLLLERNKDARAEPVPVGDREPAISEARLELLERAVRSISQRTQLTARLAQRNQGQPAQDAPSESSPAQDVPLKNDDTDPFAVLTRDEVATATREYQEERFADLQAEMMTEGQDSEWEQGIAGALEPLDTDEHPLTVDELECGSTLCKVSYSLNPEQVIQHHRRALLSGVMERLADQVGAASTLFDESSGRLTMYVARTGHGMPAAKVPLSYYERKER